MSLTQLPYKVPSGIRGQSVKTYPVSIMTNACVITKTSEAPKSGSSSMLDIVPIHTAVHTYQQLTTLTTCHVSCLVHNIEETFVGQPRNSSWSLLPCALECTRDNKVRICFSESIVGRCQQVVGIPIRCVITLVFYPSPRVRVLARTLPQYVTVYDSSSESL